VLQHQCLGGVWGRTVYVLIIWIHVTHWPSASQWESS